MIKGIILALAILSVATCDKMKTRQLKDEVNEMLSDNTIFQTLLGKGTAELEAIFKKNGLYDKPITAVSISKFDLKGKMPNIASLAEILVNNEFTAQVLVTFDMDKNTMVVENAWIGPFKKFSELFK